jgi:acetyl-CoA carboxylase biotin carboxyl carrier protein
MDEDFILKLIDKFNAGDTAELELRDGSLHLVLRKENAPGAFPGPGSFQNSGNIAGGPGSGTGSGAFGSSPVAGSNPVPQDAAGASGRMPEEVIACPIVATFYASPGPGEPAFVTRGSRVKAGDTLCILEAMKMMNHLEAEFDCEILSVKAESGDSVEYGQPLFVVKRL